MGGLFSKANRSRTTQPAAPAAPNDVEKAVIRLKVQRDKLRKRIGAGEAKSAALREEARRCVRATAAGDTPATGVPALKRKAVASLKTAKLVDDHVDTAADMLQTVTQQILAVEQGAQTARVLATLDESNEVLRALQSSCGVERVEEVLGDMDAAAEAQAEIDAAFAEFANVAENEDLQVELQQMEEQRALEMRAKLPSVPVGAPVAGAAAATPAVVDQERVAVAA